MEVMQAIKTRRSVRRYKKDQPITSDDLHLVLRAAMQAPSAMNKQPWEFVVVTHAKMLEKMMEMHPYAAFLLDAGTAIVVCEDTAAELPGKGPIDVSLAAENLMLAAHELGYGTCYCGVYPDAERMANFANLLKLPAHVIVSGIISIGTPAQKAQYIDRFEPSKIHNNVW